MDKYCNTCYLLWKKGEYELVGTVGIDLPPLRFHPRCIFGGYVRHG